MRRRKQKAAEEIGKPLKKIFLDFSEFGKPLKKIKLWARKIGWWARKISIFPKTFSSFWQFGGLILTPNLLPRALMDLLDWYFSFSTTHNLTLAFETITSHKFLWYTPSLEVPTPFTQQVMSPKQVTLGASILGLSFLKASYPPWRRDSLSTPSIKDSRVIWRSWLKLLVNPSSRTTVVVD